MLKYALIGNKIQYSISPQIYKLWFKMYEVDAQYEMIDIALHQSFKAMLIKKIKAGFSGFNITQPYKEQIIPLLTEQFKPVKLTNSVNTIQVINEQILGYNTDYLGLLDSFLFYQLNLQNKNILILGAGGVAKSLIYALNSLNLKSNIFVYNRSSAKLVDSKILFPNIIFFQSQAKQSFDVIFNATTIKTIDLIKVTKLFLKKGTIIYNLNYNTYEMFNSGVTVINGLYMLLSQASYNFKIWFKLKPEINQDMINYFSNIKN